MAQPFEQNVIAIIWDFDKTLIDGYMQEPIFEKYAVDGTLFWTEVNSLYEKYAESGIRVNKDTVYLNHFLTCVQQGVFSGLNNKILRELGNKLNFFKGLPDFFAQIKNSIVKDDNFKRYNISLEHYIVSTGLAEMIKGSEIYNYVDGIWGCEFIEDPIKSNLEIKEYKKKYEKSNTEISQIGYAIDNTSKTRAIFEINKGSNKHVNIDVNSNIQLEARRVPFGNMIYVADGPSDVPSFSVVKQNSGSTFAVYRKGKKKEFEQVDQLRKDNRIDMYGEADYSEGTLTYMWLMEHVNQIARKIVTKREEAISESVSKPPGHINE